MFRPFRPLMKFALAVVCFAAVLPTAAQRLTQGGKVAEVRLPDFPAAYCSSLPSGFRVCRVRTSEDGDADFLIQKNGSTISRIQAPFWSLAGADPDNFIAYRGDLDMDGSQEIVLVSQEGVSNGMGITYSTAYIFDSDAGSAQLTSVSFPIEEFGEKDNFIYNPKTRQVEILISYWRSYDSIDPKRGWGMYLIGKWFKYRGGRLEPIPGRPTLARRFLYSFAEERDNGWFENRTPNKWLRDRRTHRLYREPAELMKPIGVRFGTIEAVNDPDPDTWRGAAFEIRADDGGTFRARINKRLIDEAPDDSMDISSVGIWKTRYVYPVANTGIFWPSVFFADLKGRRVRVETYKREWGDEFSKLWLLD